MSGGFVGGGGVGLGVAAGGEGVSEGELWALLEEVERDPAEPEIEFLFLSTWPHLNMGKATVNKQGKFKSFWVVIGAVTKATGANGRFEMSWSS